jgi:hypothetical protein
LLAAAHIVVYVVVIMSKLTYILVCIAVIMSKLAARMSKALAGEE